MLGVFLFPLSRLYVEGAICIQMHVQVTRYPYAIPMHAFLRARTYKNVFI